MDNSAVIVAVITGTFAVLTAAVGGVILYRQTIRQAAKDEKLSDNTRAIEAVKATAIEKAESVKSASEAETKRIDAMVDLAMRRIEGLEDENKSQRDEMIKIRASNDETRTKLDVCLGEKAKAEIEANRRIAALENKIAKLEEGDEMTKRYLLMEDKIMKKAKDIKNGNSTIKPKE